MAHTPAQAKPIRTIYWRWWMYVLVLIVLPILSVMTYFAGIGAWEAMRDGRFLAAIFLPLIAFIFATTALIIVNRLLGYKVEVWPDGMRIVGFLYSHRLDWAEIIDISPHHNFRVPGYHVGILVDGSNNPQRHWSNFGFKGYYTAAGMTMGGKDLSAYLNRKRNEWLKRSSAITPQTSDRP